MTVVREERKDLLAEIAKRAGERRAQVQNILERYAKEKDQQPPSPGPAVTPASPKAVSTPSPAGAAAAARMAPATTPMSPATASSVRSSPAAAGTIPGPGALDRAVEQIVRLDRRVDTVERRLEEGAKRIEDSGQRQAESIRVLEQSVRRGEAIAKLIEEVARRTERLEARVADIELRPEPVPPVSEDGVLAVLESRLAELDQQAAQFEGLTETVRQLETDRQGRLEEVASLEERIRAFERLTERIDSMERSVRQQSAQEQRFYALEDAIARLTNQIDQLHRPLPTARIDAPSLVERPARPDGPSSIDTDRVITPAVSTGPFRKMEPEAAELPPAPVLSANFPVGTASEQGASVANETARVRPTATEIQPVAAETAEVRPPVVKPPVRERDQDKLKGVLDTLARLTAELHEMSEQRRFGAGA